MVVGSAYVQNGFENEENNNIVTLNLLDEDSGENDKQGCSTFNGKKRAAKPSVWKRNIVKSKRAKGEGIVSLRGKIVQKRTTGVDCKCKSECFKQFTDEQKKLTIDIFNNISNKENQDTFLGGLIIINNVARHRPVNNSKQPRSLTCKYKNRFDGIDENAVCKKAFCSLFGIGKRGSKELFKK